VSGLTVVLAGEESAGLRVLKRLSADAEHRVAAVLTSASPGSSPIASIARARGLNVLPAEPVRDPGLAARLRQWKVDLFLNVYSLFVVHADVVRAPRIGSFNLHPGPLPEYAGLNAPSWAIANGETRHGVTVHWMEAQIDTGAIAYDSAFEVDEADTGLSVSLRCVEHGMGLVERLLEDAAADPRRIPARSQDLARRRYYGKEVPDGGAVRWERPARRIVDLVRACDYGPFPSPWGHPRADLGGQPVEIVRSARTGEVAGAAPGTVGRVDAEGALVAAGDEWVRVLRVAEPGGAAVEPRVLVREGDRVGNGRPRRANE
jgi:UDP-4-amino-4-deoxy-L-arabinose formyltransferase/UDP-glucuronic acid dehydrogenase (UDP-4-keto-hexauronic acid decarboxylating)